MPSPFKPVNRIEIRQINNLPAARSPMAKNLLKTVVILVRKQRAGSLWLVVVVLIPRLVARSSLLLMV